MDDIKLDDILGSPTRGLEIDTSVPVHHLEDYGIDNILMESRALDVSFGKREVTISVTKAKGWLE